jgi:hypothetical protein
MAQLRDSEDRSCHSQRAQMSQEILPCEAGVGAGEYSHLERDCWNQELKDMRAFDLKHCILKGSHQVLGSEQGEHSYERREESSSCRHSGCRQSRFSFRERRRWKRCSEGSSHF